VGNYNEKKNPRPVMQFTGHFALGIGGGTLIMKLRMSTVFCVAAALSGFGGLEAQNWFQASPPGRCCMGVAFDVPAQFNLPGTLLFGGFDFNQVYGDTWILRYGGWFQLNPVPSPSPRGGPGMAYDAATQTVVLFGGSPNGDFGGVGGIDYNDTWIWDGKTWTNVSPLVSPPGRRFDTQGMAYDARTGTVVLFGGITANQQPLSDTWTWNGKTRTWTQHSSAVHPSARRAPMAYDGATGAVILFGGDDGNGAVFGDTWAWNGMTWLLLSPQTAPGPRAGAQMAYDAGLRQVVMFGGSDNNDTWTWNGTNWTLSAATGPCGRTFAGMVYDLIAQGEVLFGGANFTGNGCFGPLGDTAKFAMAP
jgi:hypothetical protein